MCVCFLIEVSDNFYSFTLVMVYTSDSFDVVVREDSFDCDVVVAFKDSNQFALLDGLMDFLKWLDGTPK